MATLRGDEAQARLEPGPREDPPDRLRGWNEQQADAGLARAGVGLDEREETRRVDRVDVAQIDAGDALELGDERLEHLCALDVQLAVEPELNRPLVVRHICPQPLHRSFNARPGVRLVTRARRIA